MTTAETTKQFNVFNYTYKNIVKAFIANGEKSEFTFNVKQLDDKEFETKEGELVKLDGSRKVIAYLNKLGALKVVKYTESYDEEGKHCYEVEIKDFNIRCKKQGKYGEYNLFANYYGTLKLQ